MTFVALSIIIYLYIRSVALYIITVVYIKFVVQDEEKNVKKSEDIEGYKGYQDVDAILQFIGKSFLTPGVYILKKGQCLLKMGGGNN